MKTPQHLSRITRFALFLPLSAHHDEHPEDVSEDGHRGHDHDEGGSR